MPGKGTFPTFRHLGWSKLFQRERIGFALQSRWSVSRDNGTLHPRAFIGCKVPRHSQRIFQNSSRVMPVKGLQLRIIYGETYVIYACIYMGVDSVYIYVYFTYNKIFKVNMQL